MTGRADVPVEPSREQGRQWVLDELGDPVYAEAQPSLVSRALSWLWEQITSIELPTGPGSRTLLVVGLVAVVVAVAVAFAVAGPVRRRARTARGGVFADESTTAAEHRRRADDAAAAGRWLEAVTERFRAVVRSLEERVVLDVRPGRTAHEAAVEAGPVLPSAAAALTAGARLFDDVVYGDRPATAEAHDRLRELDDLVQRTRPGDPATAAAPALLQVPR